MNPARRTFYIITSGFRFRELLCMALLLTAVLFYERWFAGLTLIGGLGLGWFAGATWKAEEEFMRRRRESIVGDKNNPDPT